MDSREELRKMISNASVGVSAEAMERLQTSLKVQAAKKMIQNKLTSGNAIDQQLMLGALRNMMKD